MRRFALVVVLVIGCHGSPASIDASADAEPAVIWLKGQTVPQPALPPKPWSCPPYKDGGIGYSCMPGPGYNPCTDEYTQWVFKNCPWVHPIW